MDQYENNRQFLVLFTENQKRIFTYILSLVPYRSDAEDIMQQTIFDMWKKFDLYEPGTNFSAWGISFARFLILKYRENQSKMQILSPETFELMTKQCDQPAGSSHTCTEALQDCIEKLNPADTRVLRLRYEERYKVNELAAKLGQNATMIYKTLAKIHTALLLCIRRTLAEGRAGL